MIADELVGLLDRTRGAEFESVMGVYGRYDMAFLSAFFDESERSGSPRVLAVAGILFKRHRRVLFNFHWDAMLRISRINHFHMVDCVQGNGEFRGMDPPRRQRLADRFSRVIRWHASAVCFCAVDSDSLSKTSEIGYDLIPSAYALCTIYCMEQLLSVKAGRPPNDIVSDGPVVYFFENGARNRGTAQVIMDIIKSDPELKRLYHHQDHGFPEKRDHAGLQAADVLAYEWALLCDRAIRNDAADKPRRIKANIPLILKKVPWGRTYFNENNLHLRTMVMHMQFRPHFAKLRKRLAGFK